jgi:hypothetical protein
MDSRACWRTRAFARHLARKAWPCSGSSGSCSGTLRGSLLLTIAQSTVSIYMVPRHGRPWQTWKIFLRNHVEEIASIDLFVVPTIAFQQLFAFLVLGHRRRQLLCLQ